jgi:putative membrane protein
MSSGPPASSHDGSHEAERHDDAVDATRRTHLANERTYLAWLRSGLAAVAVGLAVAKFFPFVDEGGATWPYVLLGIGFCSLGVAMMLVGVRRLREVTASLERGSFGPLEDHVALLLGALSTLLALATILLIVLGS